MKKHLLRVERPVVEFEQLIAAMRHQGERAGWLELPEKAAEPLPESLMTAGAVPLSGSVHRDVLEGSKIVSRARLLIQ